MQRETKLFCARPLPILSALVCTMLLGAGCSSSAVDETDEPERTLFMFVQEGNGGTVTDNGDGTMTLTIDEPVPYTFYFSDRPETIAGSAPMGDFVENFSWGSFEEGLTPPPNAALTLVNPETGSEDVVIVQLTSPAYDEESGSLSYQMKILTDYEYVKDGSDLQGHLDSASTVIPESFGEVSLFIDDCPDLPGNCYGGYQMNAKRGCRTNCGSVGPVPQCWHWLSLSCSPCFPEKVLDECTAPGGYCTKEGSIDPNCWHASSCATSPMCI